MVSGAKRYLLLGFVAVLLVAIPATVYYLQQQQQPQSNAEASTVLSFQPTSSQTTPIQKQVGDTIPLDIYIDPGKNLVSLVKIEIQYDPTKIATSGATPFTLNSAALPVLITGPIYSNGKIGLVASVGADPTAVIKTPTKIGTITFKALANTDSGTPTQITYTSLTSISSAAGPSTGSNDTAAENVLSSTNPAFITIGATSTTGTPTDTPTTGPTGAVTDTPTIAPTATNTPSPTGTGGGTGLSCNSLQASPSTSGTAPFAVTFTAAGTTTQGTISKVTFNFGDGTNIDVTDSGGIGTNSVSSQTQHTYASAGTYTASAVMTDDSGNVSNSSSCTTAITVTNGTTAVTPTTASTIATATPTTPISSAPGTATPTLAATGPGDTIVGAGLLITIVTVIGGVLFFAL